MTRPGLSAKLQERRAATGDWQPLIDKAVTHWRAIGVGQSAPRAGDRFPDFAVPDSRGRLTTLAELTADGPLVFSFNRGGWCPYCLHELEEWNAELHRVTGLGARFAAITAETGRRAAALGKIFSGAATLLCDVDHGLALSLGLAFHVGAETLAKYKSVGLELDAFYGSAAGLLPVPATFVIDRRQMVRFAFVDVDFRLRAEPSAVIDALATLD